jgi:oligopeptide transport system substrate-binding protein
MKKKLTILLGTLVLASMVLSACGGAGPGAATEPVTLHLNWGTEPPTADPSLATDNVSIGIAGNIFVGLTRFDAVSGDVIPDLAESWEVSDDGLVWTFHLRSDIPWVHYNTATAEVDLVTEGGDVSYVDAYDVEYGVRRTVDPATASDYSYVLYILKNAYDVNHGTEGFTVADVGVRAVDATTVEFTLENPAGYFPAIAGMWVAYPTPQGTIESAGDSWTEPGTVVTNGRYVMVEWVHGSELNLEINPHHPDADDIQIERIEGLMIQEASTAFALYENNELDTTGAPLSEVDRIKADPVLSAQYYNAPDFATYYYGFTNNKPPMDDVRVRQAFTMAVDKVALVENVLKGGQVPATFFAAPGIFGAPELGTVGLAYDPAAATALLQEYLDEKGMTLADFNALGVTLMHNTSEGHARIAAAIQQMWVDNLGVTVNVENQEWKVYLETLNKNTPLEDMPHIWRMGWGADYPDENNWVHEVFNAQAGANRLRRNCSDDVCTEITASEFDNLTVQAGQEQDPAVRLELYEDAERILAEVECAYIPMYHYAFMAMTQPWLTRTYAKLGANAYWEWTIDWEAKQAATG